jgi:hypothetical protein
MTAATQTLSAMLEALPPREQESILDKIRPIIADAMDEIKWSGSYQKSSKNLEDFAQKVRGIEKAAVLGKIDTLTTSMKTKSGFLSLSFKQMTGESTMVKNYPNNLKGVLDRGFATTTGAPTSSKIPYFYTLFIRFDSYDNMVASGAQQWFKDNIVPSLFAYNAATTPPTKTPVALDYYEGIYVTVSAGNRAKIYTSAEEIKTFLQNQSDEVGNRYVTVENHVMIITPPTN